MIAFVASPTESDTIPRIHQLVPHMRGQLLSMRDEGATFEDARRRCLATVDRLAAEGLGRKTASRVSDDDAGWSTTKDVLEEGMRLGWIERKPLPSARRYVEAHRSERYLLTPLGEEAALEAESDVARFFSRLTDAVVAVHPYFRQLILVLSDGPLICPEISEGQLEKAREERRAVAWWADHVATRLNAQPSAEIDAAAVAEEISAVLGKRFGAQTARTPPRKALVDALNEGFLNAALRSRGLRLGGINFRSLKAWGQQLRVLDESRYVPQLPQSNVLWIAANVMTEGDALSIVRRGLSESGAEVAKEFVEAYQEQARQLRQSDQSSLEAPYIPIYRVRAQAAFRARVTRALCDQVLEKLVNGEFSAIPATVQLHLGRDVPPPSEPVYRRGGTRRYEMTIARREATQ
jgi:hypothetical protein